MPERDFLELAQGHIHVCRELPLPAILCDRSFRVWWNNPAAALRCGYLTGENGLRQLLAEFRPEQVFPVIERQGSCTLEQVLPLRGDVLSFTPVYDGESVAGAVVLVIGGDVAPPMGYRPRQSGGTALALSSNIRQGVDRIFEAMDAAYLRAVMLDGSSWLSPHLNSVSIGANRILRTAVNISEYAKLQTGDLELRYSSVNLFSLLREIEETVTELCSTLEIPVSFDIPEGDVALRLDAERFEISFYNVLYNCLIHTKSGNEITVSALRQSGQVLLRIEDKGLGIPEDLLEEVFLPYRSYAHFGGEGGVGLGLTLAKRLTEAQGGTLALESRLGEGTSVTFTYQDRSFSQELTLAHADPVSLTDRFSGLYVGLVGNFRKPYGPAK